MKDKKTFTLWKFDDSREELVDELTLVLIEMGIVFKKVDECSDYIVYELTYAEKL